ncbi:OmpP1/FadL family transporter [Caenimonas terrae]|uniref:OmpP1/FadL family transporter n=1 Tax=Caenimonas terrae TaxID=696074 RepID=A0ABW0N831_9BURK
MTTTFPLKRLAPLALAVLAWPALATNGYFPHGYGLKAKGMGGTATALAQDAMGGANNPASMVWAGSRLDIGADVFSPRRDAERSGAGFPTLNGGVDSGRNYFLVPEVGYNRMISNDLSLGVTVYGNGGMNTSYPAGNFNCGGGAANMLCGAGSLGIDMMQLIVAPTVAWKFHPRHSVGASLLLGYQRFKANGLQAFDNAPGFPPFTQAPGHVTNNGTDSSTGVGVRVGYFGQITDQVSIGASYSPKMNMGRFDKYSGLFAGAGDFDIPENYGAGIAFRPLPAWLLAMDYQRINYSGVPSVGNSSAAQAPLGAANGPGFGWRDTNVLKFGVAWEMNSKLTLRAGINRGDNPITPADVTFNILAPGVMRTHYTLGATYAMSSDSELTAAFMMAPRTSVTGASLFNGVLGAGAAGNETIGMRQYSLGIAWARKF